MSEDSSTSAFTLTEKQMILRDNKRDLDRIATVLRAGLKPKPIPALHRKFKRSRAQHRGSKLMEMPDETLSTIFGQLVINDEPLRKAIVRKIKACQDVADHITSTINIYPEVLTLCQRVYDVAIGDFYLKNSVEITILPHGVCGESLLVIMGSLYKPSRDMRYGIRDLGGDVLPAGIMSLQNFQLRVQWRPRPDDMDVTHPWLMYPVLRSSSRALVNVLFQKDVRLVLENDARWNVDDVKRAFKTYATPLKLMRCQSFRITSDKDTPSMRSLFRSLEMTIVSAERPIDMSMLHVTASHFFAQIRTRFFTSSTTSESRQFQSDIERIGRRAAAWDWEGFKEVWENLMVVARRKMATLDALRMDAEDCMPEENS